MSLEEAVYALRDTEEGPRLLAPLASRIAALVDIDGTVLNGRLFPFLYCIYSCLLMLPSLVQVPSLLLIVASCKLISAICTQVPLNWRRVSLVRSRPLCQRWSCMATIFKLRKAACKHCGISADMVTFFFFCHFFLYLNFDFE